VIAECHLALPTPLYIVPDSREAYGRICHRLADSPSRHLCTVGVTGTNGKTTTSLLIASLLQAAGHPTGVLNSLVYDDTDRCQPAPQTTPPAPELAKWLSRMRDNGCSHAVVEASSRALADRTTAGLELDAAVLTNMRRDHLDLHGSIFNYRRAKARLFDHLKPGGFVVANADDPATRFLLRDVHHPVLTVGMRTEAELSATVVERHAGEQTFLLSAGNETAAVQTALFGDHHVYNCLAAAAVGLVLGIDLTTIARGLEAVTWIEGRMEPIVGGQPFGVYVDHAHTPDALAMTLKTLRQVTPGRVLCVLAADADGDPSQRPLLGRVLERGADVGMITGGGTCWQESLQTAHDILDGYDRPAKAHLLPDRAEAIRWLLGEAGPDDAVLIAGQSQDADDGSRWDVREVARHWIREVGAKIDYQQTPPRSAVLRMACSPPVIN
jgi:UDP-N-acetylmuramoyl-L-alanyl-D-glutamate--2,6-diaminopimelate ligase